MAHGDTSGGFEEVARMARLVRRACDSNLPRARRRGGRALPRVRSGRAVPIRTGAQVHPVRRLGRPAVPLRDHLGFERNVIVQATCHGADNRALVDALQRSEGRARGVATVRRDVTEEEPRRIARRRRRGVRFNFVKRLVDRVPTESLDEIVAKIAPLGWHVVIYFEAEDLPELYDFFSAIPTDLVVDHMGRPDVTKDPNGPEFELFLRFMRENPNVWTKVSCPERLSSSGPRALDGEQNAYTDVVPFARRVVEEFPDRVLWGTDWPHPNLKDHMPDDGLLVDFIPHIAPTPDLQQKLLVDNPTRLYWPEGA